MSRQETGNERKERKYLLFTVYTQKEWTSLPKRNHLIGPAAASNLMKADKMPEWWRWVELVAKLAPTTAADLNSLCIPVLFDRQETRFISSSQGSKPCKPCWYWFAFLFHSHILRFPAKAQPSRLSLYARQGCDLMWFIVVSVSCCCSDSASHRLINYVLCHTCGQ